ncbi:MAG: CTP synthase, partial [Psychromonas sp.]
GKIYQAVIEKERKGEFLGKTVQVIPHITDEIKDRIQILGKSGDYDIVITEIGGTVGDIESLPYVEAVRQMMWEFENDCIVIHLTLIPYLAAAGELKTKPTQHSVKQLLELGVQPDILCCRTEHPLDLTIRKKIAKFCNVSMKAVIESRDANTIYEVPSLMQSEELDKVVLEKLGFSSKSVPNMDKWEDFIRRIENPKSTVKIGLIGKYVELKDSYKSISEAFIHAGAENECHVEVEWLHSEKINSNNVNEKLAGLDGILVAPGFGSRGISGKIEAVRFARENKVPFFGICLGMQCAVIEFARHVLGWSDAHTSEIAENSAYPVISMMEEQKNISNMGGTMRLGAYKCQLKPDSKVAQAYNTEKISERHRHRFEFNNEYLADFEKAGMISTGKNPETGLVEVVEIKDHPWFIGAQFHPEYKSTVARPHPLFVAFINAAIQNKK